MKNLPETTFAGIVLPLLNGLRAGRPLHYRLTVRAQVADQGREIAANQVKRNVAGVFLGLSGQKRNLQAEASHEAAEGALEEMLKKGQRIYRVSVVLIVFAPTLKELGEATDEALLAVRRVGGADGMVEEYAQDEALVGSLPGTSIPLVRHQETL